MARIIDIRDLKKSFKGKPALHGISFGVERGEIFGLLGHNGAGKSTTFGILLGQVYADGGEAFIGGVSVQKNRATALARVGAIFEAPCFYDYMSGWKNLEIFSSYTGLTERAEMDEVVELVGLTDRIHDRVGTYSHGMRQRLGLAQALLPDPDLLLLDEPTEGLDPEGIHEMRHMILRLSRKRGLTVLLSSHLLSEVEQLCDRIAILHHGKLVYSGHWQDLAYKGQRYRLEVDDWEKVKRAYPAAERVESDVIELPKHAEVSTFVAAIVSSGVKLRALERQKQSLEELYLEAIAKK